jgi:predicted Zn-ribbon and HTH transcriptional regulator
MNLINKYLGEGSRARATMKSPMICIECGHKFKRVIGPKTIEVKCPKCKGYDTEPA